MRLNPTERVGQKLYISVPGAFLFPIQLSEKGVVGESDTEKYGSSPIGLVYSQNPVRHSLSSKIPMTHSVGWKIKTVF